jgi:hypothetical protein
MTVPVNNANFTTSAGRDQGRLDTRQGTAPRTTDRAAGPGDSVNLTTPAAQPAADTQLASLDDARAVLARVKQQIASNPAAALASQRGLNPTSAAMTLGSAA